MSHDSVSSMVRWCYLKIWHRKIEIKLYFFLFLIGLWGKTKGRRRDWGWRDIGWNLWVYRILFVSSEILDGEDSCLIPVSELRDHDAEQAQANMESWSTREGVYFGRELPWILCGMDMDLSTSKNVTGPWREKSGGAGLGRGGAAGSGAGWNIMETQSGL